ncbi:LysR family transcriptional regulator [Roseibium sp.]|uniref:LysR family transcriptional regulator n=1 Tax=Roseibium sp. TaxID=1936156 RepID=UPI003A982134
MTDRLQTMSILLRVIDEGSISAGARALGMPVATVSRRISDLETALTTQLVLRSRQGLALTDSGAAYAAACRRILEDVAEAEQVAAGEFVTPRGTLHLTAPIEFGQIHVLPIIIDFLRSYPEVSIRFDQADHPINLIEARIDLAVRIGALADSNLMARKVGELRRVVCASPAYLECMGVPSEPEDLAGHACINFDRRGSTNAWVFNANGAIRSLPVTPTLRVTTAEAAASAAQRSLGLTQLLSYQVSRAVKDGSLVPVLTDFEPEPAPVHLVYEPQTLPPQKLRAFIDFSVGKLRKSISDAAF